MKKNTLKQTLLCVVMAIAVIALQSCDGSMKQKIGDTSIPDEEVVKFSNIELNGDVVLTGPELYETITDFIDDIRSTSTADLDEYDKKALELFDKITYKECHEYLSELLTKSNASLKGKHKDLYFLDEELGIFDEALDIIDARKEIKSCMTKWDAVKFIENYGDAYCLDGEDYKGAKIDDGLVRMNAFIDEKSTSFTEQDYIDFVKYEALGRSSLFTTINSGNVDDFAKDVVKYMLENRSESISEQIPKNLHERKLLWVGMAIVAAKKYGGNSTLPSAIAESI